ncbi:hypothetical protein HNR42_003131 [Deinobacterium chartae]|uniref:Restriction endonuclease type IV Mrr domain-containing protein n=1 Tax=Deinobacterium chartae TaxID=521158 RepID=A0A841I317_9DEIO|nr:restriction endonuclease [Deinobacterium chartae]MBB6099673.1 hypothetical protein [Deinobacterium chartae]
MTSQERARDELGWLIAELEFGGDRYQHPHDLAARLKARGHKISPLRLMDLVRADIQRSEQAGEPPRFHIGRTYGATGYMCLLPPTRPKNPAPPIVDTGEPACPQPHQKIAEATPFKKAIRPPSAREVERIRRQLLRLDPFQFEALVERVMTAMGVQDVRRTPNVGDMGVDVRGTLVIEELIHIHVAVQVKRYANNVARPDIQRLRGSLANHELGWFVTTAGFSENAIIEARENGRLPISLITGTQFVRLMLKYDIALPESPVPERGARRGTVRARRGRARMTRAR